MRVLVVDANDIIRQMFEWTLADIAEVDCSPDGQNVCSVVAGRNPDLIFLDLSMPKVNGFTVLERVSDRDEAAVRRTIVVTAHDDAETRRWVEAFGVADISIKPTDFRHSESIASPMRGCTRRQWAASTWRSGVIAMRTLSLRS